MTTYFLPIDKTGTSLGNRRATETHTSVSRETRVMRPKFGAFFTESMKVTAHVNAGTTVLLTRGVDYEFVEFFKRLSMECGKEICGAILILDQTLSETISLTYQAYGGPANADFQALATTLRDWLSTSAEVDWDDILDKPQRFPPAAHLQDCLDLYGLEYVTSAVTAIASAIDVGDYSEHSALYHQLGLRTKEVKTLTSGVILSAQDHPANSRNSHNVTKAQVGLSELMNYSLLGEYAATTASVPGSWSKQYGATSATAYVSPLSVKAYCREFSERHTDAHVTTPLSDYVEPESGTITTALSQSGSAEDKLNLAKSGFYAQKTKWELLNDNACAAQMLRSILAHQFSSKRTVYSVPDKLAGLSLWLDFGDSSKMTFWTDSGVNTIKTIRDKSSVGRVFTSSSASASPRYRASNDPDITRSAVASFDTGLMHMNLTSGVGFTPESGMTIIAVARAGEDGSTLRILSKQGEVRTDVGSASVYIHGETKGSIHVNRAYDQTLLAGAPNTSESGSYAITVASCSAVKSVQSWAAGSVVPNLVSYPRGVSSSAVPTSAQLAAIPSVILDQLGANQASLMQRGEIAELIIYDRQLSECEVQAIAEYLRVKWTNGLALPLNLTFVRTAFANG